MNRFVCSCVQNERSAAASVSTLHATQCMFPVVEGGGSGGDGRGVLAVV